MAVNYLSPQWAAELDARLADSSVREAFRGNDATIQQVITDTEEGEKRYWLRAADGEVSAGLGEIESPEITITQSYETAVQMNKGELDGQRAFMLDKIKFRGNMMKMMKLRGPMAHVQKALADIETEY